ncbi:MAG: hypothetical protein ABIH66_14830 [bacterium]
MKKLGVTLLLSLTFAAAAGATQSGIWTQAGVEAFYNGKFNATALTSEGAIVLAPEITNELSTPEPFIWSISLDPHGNLWAGTGMKAILYRIDKNKKENVSFMPGASITKLAYDGKKYIYAAGFPPANVFRFDQQGNKELYAEVGARYAWDIALAPDGKLYVATGMPAGIYMIEKPGAQPVPVFNSSSETHVLSLALDPDGNLYAGTAPGGLVLKVDRESKTTVLDNLDEDEAYRMSWTGGRLIVAGNYEQSSPQQGAPQPPQRQEPKSFPVPPSNVPQAAIKPANIYEILPSGRKKHVFQADDPFILSMLPIDNDSLYVGTGNEGRLYRINLKDETATLTQLPTNQILGIAKRGRKFYFSTGYPGAVFSLDESLVSEGTFESTINDIGTTGTWGKVWIESDSPADTTIAISTRAGNTPAPDNTWATWSPAFSTLPHEVDSPPGRHIQYMARLSKGGGAKESPSLREVNVSYIPPNREPEITEIKVLPEPMERKPPSPQPQQPQTQGPPQNNPNAGQPPPPPPPPQRNIIVGTVRTAGVITIRWKASDPDNDLLRCTLHFRRIPAEHWTLIEKELTASEFKWDVSTIPDGKYEVKVTVTDEPANPPGEAEEDSDISDPFIIDNTPPSIRDVSYTKLKKGGIEITGRAEDNVSIISGLQYSVDEIDWKPLLPADRIFDSQIERFRFTIDKLEPGEHLILLRTRDFVGNPGSYDLRVRTD